MGKGGGEEREGRGRQTGGEGCKSLNGDRH